MVKYTYNTYLEELTRTETFTAADTSTATRTVTSTYDAAGRATGSSLTTSGTRGRNCRTDLRR